MSGKEKHGADLEMNTKLHGSHFEVRQNLPGFVFPNVGYKGIE
jgi:hypothetical protein